MSGLKVDFVVYLGDPDDGAEALTSKDLLAVAAQHRDQLRFPDVYGAVIISEGDKELVDRKPDPIFPLVANLVRAVASVIDGESELQQLAESEHGFALEPNGDDVMIGMFAGDPYEPDEWLLAPQGLTMEAFGDQVLEMGRRLKGIIDAVDPEAMERDDYLKGLTEFLEVSGDALKTYKLEKQRGLRV
ncbi:MAG: hypothetical protein H6730_02900 [Deltaproteobacteria bacterium]|nr:hypothetical protein [Deltaproteobacteria bacterium]